MRQVLAQAVADGRLDANPADYVKLPTDRNTGHVRAVDDPAQFLTAAQVAALVPRRLGPIRSWCTWPRGRVCVQQSSPGCGWAMWQCRRQASTRTRLRSRELRVEQTIAWIGAQPMSVPFKTKGSRRTVPLTAAATNMLRDYLAAHPRKAEPTAPLFPSVRLLPPRPTGVQATDADPGDATRDGSAQDDGRQPPWPTSPWPRQPTGSCWTGGAPNRHATFYKAVLRPAVLRANRQTPTAALPQQLKFHALRHTYASLC